MLQPEKKQKGWSMGKLEGNKAPVAISIGAGSQSWIKLKEKTHGIRSPY